MKRWVNSLEKWVVVRRVERSPHYDTYSISRVPFVADRVLRACSPEFESYDEADRYKDQLVIVDRILQE